VLDLAVVVVDHPVLLQMVFLVVPIEVGQVGTILLDEPHWHELELILGHGSQLVPPLILILEVVLLLSESYKSVGRHEVALLLRDSLFKRSLLLLHHLLWDVISVVR